MAAFTYNKKQIFSFFRAKDEKHPGYGKSVEEYHKGKDLMDKFILAWDPPKEMQRREKKLFIVFKDAREAFEWVQTIPAHQRSFYEYALGPRAQKPHFDIDCEINATELAHHQPLFESYFTSLLRATWDTLNECGIVANVAEQFRVYDSSGPKDDGKYKLSRHLIITGVQHNNNKEAGRFYGMVKERLVNQVGINLVDNVYKLDSMVYSSKQQFRLLGSSKSGANRPKSLLPTVSGIPIAYSDVIKDVAQGYATTDYADFLDSVLNPIGNVADLTPICHPNLFAKERSTYDCSAYNLLEDPYTVAQQYLNSDPRLSGYSIGDYDDIYHSIRLNNKGNAFCISHCRNHASNGAVIRFHKDGTAKFWCFSTEGHQDVVTLGKVEVETEDDSDNEEEEVEEESPTTNPASAEYRQLADALKEEREREEYLEGAKATLNTFMAKLLPNSSEGRYITRFEPTHELGVMGYQDLRGWCLPPSIGAVEGRFMKKHWDIPIRVRQEKKVEAQEPVEQTFHNPYEVPEEPEYIPDDAPQHEKYSMGELREVWKNFYHDRAIKFFETTNDICRYLSRNHKIRLGELHRDEKGNIVRCTKDGEKRLTFRFRKPAPLEPKDKGKEHLYPLGYKFVKVTKDEAITYTINELMNGDHLQNASFCPHIRERYRLMWNDLRTKLDPNPNTIPYFPGDPVPLRHKLDVNEFPGYGVRNTKEICEKYGNNIDTLRNHPLVQPYLFHAYHTFCRGDMRKLNEILSFIIYPLVRNGVKTGKILSMFGDKSAGKSLFFDSVLKLIYGHLMSVGNKLKSFTQQFNASFVGKMFVLADEAVSGEVKTQAPAELISALKNTATGDTKMIRGLYKEEVEVVNYCNVILISNHASACNWIEKDKNNKRNLTYESAIIGYDSISKEYVTSMDSHFTTRTNVATGKPALSTQPSHLLLQNYYKADGMNVGKRLVDIEAIEHFVAYLYLYANTPGSGFIDFANVTYNQPNEAIHETTADGWMKAEKLFVESLVGEEGYKLRVPGITPRVLGGKKNAGFLYLSYEDMYEEFKAWHMKRYPGARIAIHDQDTFISGMTSVENDKLHIFSQAGKDTRVTFPKTNGKYTGYGFRQPNLSLYTIEGISPVVQNEFARQTPVVPAQTAPVVPAQTVQVPTQSPHTAQFGPQGGFVLTQETKSTMAVHPPSPNTIAQIAQDPRMKAYIDQMVQEQIRAQLAQVMVQYKQ